MKSRLLKLMVATAFTLGVCFLGHADGKDLVKANIPQIYGKAKDAFTGNSDKTIIHIQDAHGNAESQENIQAIVKSLAEQGKIDAIADEGGSGEYDYSGYKNINEEDSQLFVDFLTKWGLTHAATRYHVLENKNVPVVGCETQSLYNDNKKAFVDANNDKKASSAAAATIKASMEALKLKLFDEETRNTLQAMDDFQNDKITLTAFSKVLKSASEKVAVNWQSYANFNKVIESVTLEDAIDFAKIDRERLDMVDELEGAVEKKSADEIVNNSLNYRLGRMSASDYYAFLLSKAGEAKIDMAKYDNVAKYAKLVKVYAEINDDALFAETSRLEAEIKSKMFKNESQVNFDKHLKGLEVLNRMINLQMTRADLAYYNENKPKAVEMIAFLKEQSKSLGLGIQVDEALSKIDESLSSNVKFYEIALKRDEAMIENTLAMMDERGFKTVVLVAGGFHTEGIMKALKAKGISSTLVTPRITNPDGANYWLQNMMGEKTEGAKILEQANSPKITTIADKDGGNGVSEKTIRQTVETIRSSTDAEKAAAATTQAITTNEKGEVSVNGKMVTVAENAPANLADAFSAKGLQLKVISSKDAALNGVELDGAPALRNANTVYISQKMAALMNVSPFLVAVIANNESKEYEATKNMTDRAEINKAIVDINKQRSVTEELLLQVIGTKLGNIDLDQIGVETLKSMLSQEQLDYTLKMSPVHGSLNTKNTEDAIKTFNQIENAAAFAMQNVANNILESLAKEADAPDRKATENLILTQDETPYESFIDSTTGEFTGSDSIKTLFHLDAKRGGYMKIVNEGDAKNLESIVAVYGALNPEQKIATYQDGEITVFEMKDGKLVQSDLKIASVNDIFKNDVVVLTTKNEVINAVSAFTNKANVRIIASNAKDKAFFASKVKVQTMFADIGTPDYATNAVAFTTIKTNNDQSEVAKQLIKLNKVFDLEKDADGMKSAKTLIDEGNFPKITKLMANLMEACKSAALFAIAA